MEIEEEVKIAQHVEIEEEVKEEIYEGQEVEEDLPIEQILLSFDSNCLPKIFP